jgi:hypothetical protein
MREAAAADAEHEQLWPFPSLPEVFSARYAVSDLGLRRFGLYESDLDVDFDRTPRPVLVTRILERCTRSAQKESVGQSLFWDLPIGKRIECLLTLLMSGRDQEITLGFRCPNTACAEESEIAISLEEVAALQKDAYAADRIAIPVENDIVALRRPTGGDQLAWLDGTFTDPEAARRAMVRTLLLDGNEGADARVHVLRDEWLESIEEAMEEHDPLVNFKLSVQCASCETTNLVAIDLEEISLRGLRNAQMRLLATVHRLAAHYHWSEQQIFDVPFARRAQYLSLIANESAR